VLTRHFGLSTRLYLNQRLTREHFVDIASHGFDRVELCAVRSHVDFHNPSALADVQQWLGAAGLELASVHAPVGGAYSAHRWLDPLSLASPDAAQRERAVAEVERALHIARRIPFRVLVVHLGWPRPAENSRDAARRSVDALCKAADPLGVTLALEVMQNELSRPASLAHFIEDALEADNVGICLDVGHAHADGDLADAIETVSEHLVALDLNDNAGRNDDHLVPFDGTIDWPAALTQVQKVGYDDTLMFEISARGPARDTLKKARKARERMDRILG
jgi:sugar phosphate isomerase/epimerase